MVMCRNEPMRPLLNAQPSQTSILVANIWDVKDCVMHSYTTSYKSTGSGNYQNDIQRPVGARSAIRLPDSLYCTSPYHKMM